MTLHTYAKATAVIFGAVALLHLARVVWGWDMKVDTFMVPVWASWVALLVAGYLAYSGWRFNER
ncbi:MAG: hypothetical protein Q8Q36_02890 [bacterium]|nr:hypothetical protein [bacterium]